MTTPLANALEQFPMTPVGGLFPRTDAMPSAPTTRPWILRFARTPDPATATAIPPAHYDQAQQISVGIFDPGLLPYMQTNAATVQDGDPNNPPPLDEGAKD